MNHRPRLLALGIAVSLSVAVVPVSTAAAASRPNIVTAPAFPQITAAQASARWLAGQLTPGGWIPSASNTPSLSLTANTVLALAAAKVDPAGVQAALTFLQANVASYVTQNGADGPGQLALLILDAEAGGVSPTNFGGTNLVARLLATEQPSGLFGTANQLVNYSAGNYEQGLALQALAAAGVKGGTGIGMAVSYLLGQQCPDGSWSFSAQSMDTCVVSATNYTGPDTNSTAQAVQGVAAQGALSPSVASSAVRFFGTGQDSDGGWSYYPSSPGALQTTDPNSTALVIQALVSIGRSPTDTAFVRGSSNPVTALLAFQLTSGPGAGAFEPSLASGSADVTASFQATPAIAGKSFAFPLGTSNGSYWLVGSDGGVFAFGGAAFLGSMGGTVLNRPIVGIAATSDGSGYWEVASDGGVFAFGGAAFHGSMGGTALNKPIVGIAATPDGSGYWEVASDGGVFAFGSAGYQGSLPSIGVSVNDIVGVTPAPAGGGYWQVASDGGVFAFGTASFDGSMGGTPIARPLVGIAATPAGGGYWQVASDGGVFAFGGAGFAGAAVNPSIVGVIASRQRTA